MFLFFFLLSFPKLQYWEMGKAPAKNKNKKKTNNLQPCGNDRNFLMWADKSTDILLLGLQFQIQLVLLWLFMSRVQNSSIVMPSVLSKQNTGRTLGVSVIVHTFLVFVR